MRPKNLANVIMILVVWGALAGNVLAAEGSPSTAPVQVSIQIDATKTVGRFEPISRFFGYDEPNYTYTSDGKKLLTELGQMGPDQVYIRCHHLLTSGDGTPALKWGSTNAYTEDPNGKPIYNWTIIDRIFDTYLERGLKPYVEIGFMPKDLSTRPDLYPSNLDPEKMTKVDGGQAYPPKDYAKWGELVYQWVHHSVEKYGRAEVEKWYWEVWNEPNILYWKGTREEYYKLYDYAIDGVRRALPTARVGGPDQAGGSEKFLHPFIEHCLHGTNYVTGKLGSPLDFVSFHAKGSPRFVDGHVAMGLSNQLQEIDRAFATIASFPELKKTPIVIGESDPDGLAALPASKAPQNGYRMGTLYPSYTAAAFARKYELADNYGVNLQGALTWAFEFENKPPFIGYRVLATNGIDLPILNVFRMFAKMSGERVALQRSPSINLSTILKSGVRKEPDINALAATRANELTALIWNYHDEDILGPDADINLAIAGLAGNPSQLRVDEYRIDETHSNSYTAWKMMGSPQNLSASQRSQLEGSGQLATIDGARISPVKDGKANINLSLPRQGVSLLVVRW